MTIKNVVLIAMLMILGFTANSHADLTVLGKDSLGDQLIYDSALNVTWYDYTISQDTWTNQHTWASNLKVTVNNVSIGGWTLPAVPSGITTAGFNVMGSNVGDQMSYLYYTELGNKAPVDPNGNPQSNWGLINTGGFKNLSAGVYWSGLDYPSINYAWDFNFGNGYQYVDPDNTAQYQYKALAIHPGSLAYAFPVPTATPIPGTLGLFGSGLAGIAAIFRRSQGKN